MTAPSLVLITGFDSLQGQRSRPSQWALASESKSAVWGLKLLAVKHHVFFMCSPLPLSELLFHPPLWICPCPPLLEVRSQAKRSTLTSESPWEPPGLAQTSQPPPSQTLALLLLLLLLQVSSWRRHIPHVSGAARNKVRQENLTGIFLFVPVLSVHAAPRSAPNTPPPAAADRLRPRRRHVAPNSDFIEAAATRSSSSLGLRTATRTAAFKTERDVSLSLWSEFNFCFKLHHNATREHRRHFNHDDSFCVKAATEAWWCQICRAVKNYLLCGNHFYNFRGRAFCFLPGW